MDVEIKARPWERRQNVWFGDHVFPKDSWEICHKAGNVRRCWDVLPKSEFPRIWRAIILRHRHIASSGRLYWWVSINLWYDAKSGSLTWVDFWTTWRAWETGGWPICRVSETGDLGWAPQTCFSSKFLNAAEAADLGPLLWEPLFCSVQKREEHGRGFTFENNFDIFTLDAEKKLWKKRGHWKF